MTEWLEKLDKQEQETTPGPWYRMAGNNTGRVAHKSGHGPFVELDEVIRFAVAFREHARELIDATKMEPRLLKELKEAHASELRSHVREQRVHLENEELKALLLRIDDKVLSRFVEIFSESKTVIDLRSEIEKALK